MKYRKRPIEVEAVQWFKLGDHPAVTRRGPFVYFDRAGHYFYIDHTDTLVPRPEFWLAVDPKGPIAQKNGEALHFAFYEVKGGNRIPAEDHPALLEAYAAFAGWGGACPRVTGLIERKHEDGGNIHVPVGAWIITAADGSLSVMGAKEFMETYELAPEGGEGMRTADEYLAIVGEVPTSESSGALFVAMMDDIMDPFRKAPVADDAAFTNLFVHKLRAAARLFDEEMCPRNPNLVVGGFRKVAKSIWSEKDVPEPVRRAVGYL